MCLDDRLARVLVAAGVDKVEVFVQPRTVRHDRCRLFARLVEAALGEHRVDPLAVLVHIDDGPLAAVVRLVVLRVRLAHQRVTGDLHLVAEPHLLLFVLVEGQTGEADHDQNHTEMDEVSAISPRVSPCDHDHAVENVCALLPRNHASAAPKLTHNSCHNEHGQCNRHQRIEVPDILPWPHAADHERNRRYDRQSHWP